MPILTPSQVHLDVPLTNLTVAYSQGLDNFVADKVFGTISVDKQSNKFYEYDPKEGRRHGDVTEAAPRTEPNRVGMTLSNDNYFATVRWLGMDFDEQTLANEDTMLDIRSQGANVLIENMLIDREKRWANTFFRLESGVLRSQAMLPAPWVLVKLFTGRTIRTLPQSLT